MFTGIVEEIGIVREASPDHLVIEAREVLKGIKISDSIAVNGACLTVTSVREGLVLSHGTFSVDVMPETSRRTNLGELHYGDGVNLERGLMVGERLGGHLVLGHVDDTGEVMSVIPEETARIMRISAPAKLMPYLARKGFIAVDGVSLTIVDLDDFSFTVSLVAYTLKHTILGNRKPGDKVNLEADVIARYVERIKACPEQSEGIRSSQGLTLDFLEEYGFKERSTKY